MITRLTIAALFAFASLDHQSKLENMKLDEQLLKAHELRDAGMIMACFSKREDAFFIAPDGTLNSGPAAIRESFRKFFAGLDAIHGDIKQISYIPVEGGVIAVGTVIYHRRPKGQPPDQRTVIWTDYRIRENGHWVYLFRHAHWPLNAVRKSPDRQKS